MVIIRVKAKNSDILVALVAVIKLRMMLGLKDARTSDMEGALPHSTLQMQNVSNETHLGFHLAWG